MNIMTKFTRQPSYVIFISIFAVVCILLFLFVSFGETFVEKLQLKQGEQRHKELKVVMI